MSDRSYVTCHISYFWIYSRAVHKVILDINNITGRNLNINHLQHKGQGTYVLLTTGCVVAQKFLLIDQVADGYDQG